MIVAIDGPAGSGKSSLSRALAKTSDFVYLDTGAMYRALTLYCLENGIDIHDGVAIEERAKNITIRFEAPQSAKKSTQSTNAPLPENSEIGQRVFLNDEDVTNAIRTSQVDENVSIVARYPGVRKIMVEAQRAYAIDQNIIAEGRDIGTAVFPQAEVKVFLSADAKQRARRRTIEREGGDPTQPGSAIRDEALYNKIYRDILKRDELDEKRTSSPLKPAPDAIHLDTTDLTLNQAVEAVRTLIHEKA